MRYSTMCYQLRINFLYYRSLTFFEFLHYRKWRFDTRLIIPYYLICKVRYFCNLFNWLHSCQKFEYELGRNVQGFFSGP